MPRDRPPVIGMCAHVGPMNRSVYDMPATFAPQSFVAGVAGAGALPVLLPPLPEAHRAVGLVDGLLLLAGPDVDPALYGADRHPTTFAQVERDEAELAMAAAALRAGLPVLGICRGLQLLNTLHGGTLHQHLPEAVGHDGHQPGELVFGPQRPTLRPGSRIAAVLGDGPAVVECHHHQSVDRLGAGLTATAWADDGTVEAVEVDGHPFGVAVQWHAEKDVEGRLFRALVDAASAR